MTRNEIKTTLKIGAIATMAFALAGAAHAQMGPPPMGPGGFGGPMPGMRGPGGPGFGGMIAGTVQSVNSDEHTISLKTRSGETCTLHVSSDAAIIGQKTIAVSDLHVGDRIQVRGHVALITADSIVAGGDGMGGPPMGPPPSAVMGGPQGFGAGPGGPGFGPQGTGRMGGPNGMVLEVGTVTKLSPLTLSFGGGRTLTVQVDSSTRVHKVGEMKLAEIKTGDRIAAQGRPMSDGSLRAVRVAVNMPVPMRPPGGPGMAGRGPGAFGPAMGGPEGPGFGPAPGFGPGLGGPPDPDNGPQQGAQPDMPPPPDAGQGGPSPDDSSPDGTPAPDAPDGPPAGLN